MSSAHDNRHRIAPRVGALAVSWLIAMAGCTAPPPPPAPSASPAVQTAATALAGPRNLAIWRMVDNSCNHPELGVPSPQAIECHRDAGYALLKDICGASHYLVIPTSRRTGIESPELLADTEPNYFALGWAERGASLAGFMHPPSNSGGADVAVSLADIGMAINSRDARSQDQLHIHIDRIRPDLRQALGAMTAHGSDGTFDLAFNHRRYRVIKVRSLTPSPFQLVSQMYDDRDVDARAHESVAVIDDLEGGFLLLVERTTSMLLDRAHTEDLLAPKACGHS